MDKTVPILLKITGACVIMQATIFARLEKAIDVRNFFLRARKAPVQPLSLYFLKTENNL